MGEGARERRDFLPVLRNRAGLQRGHLVGEVGLSVGLVLAGGAAHCGSTGGGRGRGGGGRSTGRVAQSGGGGGAAVAGGGSGGGGRRSGLLLLGLLAGELGHAEDELEAAQLDVAAVVEEGRALPARPAAADQAGAARLAAAGRVGSAAAARLTAHHAAGQ